MKRGTMLAAVLAMLAVSSLASAQVPAREVLFEHRSESETLGTLSFAGAGPGLPVSSLQQLRFALEYDPLLLQIDELRPAGLLVDHPPDALNIVHLSGRVEVALSYAAPVAVDASVQGDLFSVDSTLQSDLYEGERVTIHTAGLLEGEPVQWIDDLGGVDDVKVLVHDRTIVGASGITCLAGDALGDGEVDAGDSGAVLRIVTGLVPTPGVAVRCGADFNQDGLIYAGDAVLILRRAAGYMDFASRGPIDPAVAIVPGPDGARLRIERAGFAYGATVRLRALGATSLESVDADATAMESARVDGAGAVIALAGVEALAGTDGVLEIRIGASGAGRIVVDELLLFGADGGIAYEQSGGLSVDLSGPPARAGVVLTNVPNPFNPVTTFMLEVPRDGHVLLELYDMKGRRLATLLDEVRPAGRSEYRFDGRVAGSILPSGIYFARLGTVAGSTVHRITLLK